ncbi:MAG: prepilin-type N-terminal cleavage/methylation domain-containing protein [Clostridia bacterium]|nr:prepilin-type N-terminal cleavage/methylation domain-containing protein [Clostridia bacterium]
MAGKLKKNNKGFSLVEMIIAIVILGIVGIPLLHAFVTSANLHTNSKKYGEATQAAQNINEIVQAFPVSYFGKSGADADQGLIDMLGINRDNLQLIQNEKDLLVNNVDTKVVGLKNIVSGDGAYDCRLTLDRGDASSSSSDGFVEINNERVAEYAQMDGVFTQSYLEGVDPDKKAIVDTNQYIAANSATLNKATIYDVKRRVAVLIHESDTEFEADGTTPLVECEVYFNYAVKIRYYPSGNVARYTMYYPGSAFDNDSPLDFYNDYAVNENVNNSTYKNPYKDDPGVMARGYSYDIFPGGVSQPAADEFLNVYLLYYPFYPYRSSGTYTSEYDSFFILNPDHIRTKAFIIKQCPLGEDYTPLSRTEDGRQTLMSKELKYNCWIRCQTAFSAEGMDWVYTNAATNLGGTGSIKSAKFEAYYNSGADGHNFAVDEGLGNLIGTTRRTRIYNVKIEVFRAGAMSGTGASTVFSGEPIYTFEGSKTKS